MKLKLFIVALFCSVVSWGQTYFLNDDFEDNNIAGWTESVGTHWNSSNASPINGSYSLKHVFSTASAGRD